MQVSLGEFREYLTLYRTVSKQCENGDVQKRRRKTKEIWGSVKALSCRNSSFSVESEEVKDGRLLISTAYLVHFREDPEIFDAIKWQGDFYKKLSGVQKLPSGWRCVMGLFEEITI